MAEVTALVGRWLFALCLLSSWYNHLLNILTADNIAYDRQLPEIGARLTPERIVWLASGVPFMFLLVAWASRFHQLIAGALILLGLIVVRRRAITKWRDDKVVTLGKYVPSAAALLAYSCAYLATWQWTETQREACAWEAACGVIAAAYLLSAVAKHKESGSKWSQSSNMGLLIAERVYGAPAPLRRLRRWAVASPRLCTWLARGAAWIEIAAVVFMFSAFRWPFAAVATSLQIGIVVLLGYIEIEWILVVVALAMTAG
jgi:hypothetical protein